MTNPSLSAELLRGFQVFEHVRWDEMDENQCQAHRGLLLIASALYQSMKALERRQIEVERAIKQIQESAPQ